MKTLPQVLQVPVLGIGLLQVLTVVNLGDRQVCELFNFFRSVFFWQVEQKTLRKGLQKFLNIKNFITLIKIFGSLVAEAMENDEEYSSTNDGSASTNLQRELNRLRALAQSVELQRVNFSSSFLEY